MSDLMLLENPRRNRKMFDFDFDNPVANPRRRRRHSRRNPSFSSIGKTGANLFQGVGVDDIIGGFAGFAASGLIPPMIMKKPVGETADGLTTRTWMTIALAGITALGAGYLVKLVHPPAAKAAIIGGMAGTLALAYQQYLPQGDYNPLFPPTPIANRAISMGQPMGHPMGLPLAHSGGLQGSGNARQFNDVTMQ